MGRLFSSRALIAICCAALLLLAALTAMQYRWSARVAAADAQREREHLDSGAALFASDFNGALGQVLQVLQNEVRPAIQSGERIATTPKLIQELFFLQTPKGGPVQTKRLTERGVFEDATAPAWLPTRECGAAAFEDPLALMIPAFDVMTTESRTPQGMRVMRRIDHQPDKCFVARLNEKYLRESFFPQTIERSFGATSMGEYDFAVVSRGDKRRVLYGTPGRPDLTKAFYSMGAGQLGLSQLPPRSLMGAGPHAIYIQNVEAFVAKDSAAGADLFGPGIWELEISRKGSPLAETFERARWRNLFLSLAVEGLLLAAIVFLVIASRRMQRTAEQKMQFIAGVSHELRTPVSAIAMLSRNQADGLVAGPEKVKQYGELIHQQSRRLNEMVEQTLEYAGIHSGLPRPDRNEVDLRKLIDEAVAARREELARYGFEVEIVVSPDLPPVRGDAKLLRTAFDNLLSNAQKYAEKGRWIRVSARFVPTEKEVQISVEDHGAGIDPADQAEIFEPFCRGRAAVEAQIPGSGLGLSLVRGAAEAHRGTVTLVSEPGRGSNFTMHLPV